MIAGEKSQRIFENIYLFLYAAMLFVELLNTTMFPFAWTEIAGIYVFFASFIVLGVKAALIDRRSTREILIKALLFVAFMGMFFATHYLFVLYSFILIVGAQDVPFRKIIRIYCIAAAVVLASTVIASQLGLVKNLIYVQGDRTRISFGFIYPTDFTALLFYFAMAYGYLRKERISYPELAGILGLGIVSDVFCDARTNSILLIMAAAVFLYLKIRSRAAVRSGRAYVMHPVLSKLLVWAMPVCAAGLIGVTFLFTILENNAVLKKLDSILTGRLNWGSLGIKNYGVHLFGKVIHLYGWGGSTTPPKQYFMLDSSYVLLLLRYGILVLLCVLLIFVLSSLRAEKQRDYTLLWILAFIAVQCAMEHHLIEAAYNPFLVLFFADTMAGGGAKRSATEMNKSEGSS